MYYLLHGRYRLAPRYEQFRRDYCINCGAEVTSYRVRTFDLWHLSYLPLLPLGFRSRWACGTCGEEPHARVRATPLAKVLGIVGLGFGAVAAWMNPVDSDDRLISWAFRVGAPVAIAGILWSLSRTSSEPTLAERLREVTPSDDLQCPRCAKELGPPPEWRCPSCGMQKVALPGSRLPSPPPAARKPAARKPAARKPAARKPPDLGIAPRLATFAKAHLYAVRTTRSDSGPDPARCYAVAHVAEGSVAGHAGVRRGDLLAFLGDERALAHPAELSLRPAEARSYRFFRPGASVWIDVEASGIEPGVQLAPTPQAVKRNFDGSPTDLEVLWEAGEWKALEELSRQAITGSRNPPGLLSRLRRSRPSGKWDTPATALFGAALFEQGDPSGMALLYEYANEHAMSWTLNYLAIALYYLGADALMSGEDDEGRSRLAQALEYSRSAVLQERVAGLTGSAGSLGPPKRWLGGPSPLQYRLDRLGASGQVSLDGALSTMAREQLLPVVLLGGYRTNGPYDEQMWRHLNFATYFHPYLAPLHVVTEAPQAPEGARGFLTGEAAMREHGAPFELLLDREQRVARTVGISHSPYTLLLAADGTVAWEGWLESTDLWGVLEQRYT